jgi:hypothetical protein
VLQREGRRFGEQKISSGVWSMAGRVKSCRGVLACIVREIDGMSGELGGLKEGYKEK